MKGLIIYDFDGVLVNSGHAVLKYYDAVFEQFNLPLIDWHDKEMRAKAFSMSHRQLMSMYADGALLEKMCEFTPPFTMEQMLQVTPLMDEVEIVIPKLAEDYHLTVFTNRATPVEPYLKHYNINNYFSYIVTSADVSEAKPSPEGVHKILNYFGLNNAMYIGDSETDYLAAKSAGVNFLAYKAVLHDAIVIQNHSEIFDYLRNDF